MSQPVIDIGILTIREDEFRAVLKVFPDEHGIYRGRHREYTLRTTDAGQRARYRLAILRQIEQGNGEAQEAARDLCDDLQPSLFLVVGIAGGLPSDDISLGDVVLSTRVLDFSVEARKFQEETTYSVGGGSIAKSIAAGVANLGARELELGNWWAELPSKPAVSLGRGMFYGPKEWQQDVREKLRAHYGKNVVARAPTFSAGPIASSDRLVKDPSVLIPWITSARGILAIEMESAGVHRATRDKTPMLSIRGLSDIVGLKRQDTWTKYACASAAAFTRGYLRTRPVSVRQSPRPEAGPAPALCRGAPYESEDRKESAQLTLVPASVPVKIESAGGRLWDHVKWEWWGAPSTRRGQDPKSWVTVRAQRAMLAESLRGISEDVKAIREVIPLAWSDDESLVRAYLGLEIVKLSGAAFLRNIGKTPVKLRVQPGDHYNTRYHRPLVDPRWQELVDARLRKEWEEHAEASSAPRVSVELAPDKLISLEPNDAVEVTMSFQFTAHSRREYTDEVRAQKNYVAYAREKEKDLLVDLACADALFEYVRGAIRGVPIQLTVFGEQRVIKADLEPVAIPAKVDFSDPDWGLVEQLSKTLRVDVLDIGERWRRIVTAVDEHWESTT